MYNEVQEELEILEEAQRLRKKKIKRNMILAAAVLILAAGATGAYFMFFAKPESDEPESDASFMQRNGSTYVTATGTTAVGIVAEEFPIDFLEDTELVVEEVYLDSGDEVTAGTRYLKFTDDSIKEARKELEDAATDASITYRNSVISTQESKISAKYAYQTTLLTGQQAQGVYDDRIAELTQQLEDAEASYNDALEEFTELQDNLTNNGFWDEFEIDEKKQAYEDNKELYAAVNEKWGTSTEEEEEEQNQSMQAGPGAQQEVDSEKQWKAKALTLIQEEYEESKNEYEQAMSDYDDAMENYELQLKKLQNNLDTAQQKYEGMQLTYQKESLAAKTTLETSLEKAKTAELDYNTKITSLDESLSKLLDDEEDAADQLTLFEETVGDGYLYTEGEGTILRIMAQEDSALEGGNMVIAYNDTTELTVNVSVSQEYISQITVGESAYISISEYGDFDGTVTTINPISSSTSRTSITYTVEVLIEGDISELSANLTASVVFGTNMEEMTSENRMTPGAEGGATHE